MKIKTLLLGAAIISLPTLVSAKPDPFIKGVKNIIVLVNDGGGHTVYDATRLYLGRPLKTDAPEFRKSNVSTHPLRPDSSTNNTPGSLDQDPAVVYDSAKFWDTTPIAGPSTVAGYSAYPAGFAGYEWSRFAHPDSGNTASSIATGVKTYNNAINVDGAGTPQSTIVDLIMLAKGVGKNTGVVTTVQFGDATPAALGGAHNIARSNRQAIAAEMFGTGRLDVIAGTGNPDFDDNGNPRTPNYSWVSQTLWEDLKNGTNVSGANAAKFALLQDRSAIEALAQSNLRVKMPPKLAMIIKGDNSAQYNRTGFNVNPTTYEPFATPLKTNVPSLGTMATAALNVLGRSSAGFYLGLEAGGVDRAEHGNNTGRMIEDMIESDNAVQAVIDWVNRADTPATWDNTLLIVTADHDHLLYGPQGDTVPFQPLQDKGPGLTPGNKWFGPNHGTGLVPLYAYGKGADQVVALASKVDSYTDANGNTFGYGAYLDQTDLGKLLKSTIVKGKAPVLPE